MSVAIATMGMFNTCCGGRVVGGGAPPYRRDEERVKPLVLVKRVEVKSINIIDELNKSITITLIDN